MRFDFDDEQSEIKDTARQFLGSRFKPEVVRRLAEDGTYDDALWTEVSELGWPGIAISEKYGGQGLGMVELMILCEELGYACAPLPFLSNAARGARRSRARAPTSRRSAGLPGIASGEGRGAFGDPSVTIDAEGAACAAVYGDDDVTRVVDLADVELEPLDLIDATRRYSAPLGDVGEPRPERLRAGDRADPRRGGG